MSLHCDSETRDCIYYAGNLRDVADKDYIASRILIKSALLENFTWCALQAIEKLCKATLLYHKETVTEFTHKCMPIVEKIERQTPISYNFNDDERHFLSVIDECWADRYYVTQKHFSSNNLPLYDKIIWTIRRYCTNIDIVTEGEDISAAVLASLSSEYYDLHPHKLHHVGGHLEKVIHSSSSSFYNNQRKALVWLNNFFGVRRKSNTPYFYFSHGMNPTCWNDSNAVTNVRKYAKVNIARRPNNN